jgi:hypothetical protein
MAPFIAVLTVLGRRDNGDSAIMLIERQIEIDSGGTGPTDIGAQCGVTVRSLTLTLRGRYVRIPLMYLHKEN